ncbi:hypothetical protein [Polaromonas sp. JS666]|uniref:hypothetical protein n=1 Tax=Polaromonas sp. (strain JS666 / ATCC BAA-500) TaxID=296591 RepID=UPI00004643A8|nr:hypothetical protein [Polaromonas sp. JS666]
MKRNEEQFWANLLVGSKPGWSVSMAECWGESSAAPAHLSANVYTFDTSTGWSGTCAVTPDDLIQAADILEGSPIRRNAAIGYAHRELVRAADGKATAREDVTRRAMVLNMYYIAQSQTLKVVRTRYGSVRGHWLCLLYRFTLGQSMIRPVFRSNVIGPKSMSQDMLAQWAGEVMHEDRNAQDSGLQRQLRAGNELLLKDPTAVVQHSR